MARAVRQPVVLMKWYRVVSWTRTADRRRPASHFTPGSCTTLRTFPPPRARKDPLAPAVFENPTGFRVEGPWGQEVAGRVPADPTPGAQRCRPPSRAPRATAAGEKRPVFLRGARSLPGTWSRSSRRKFPRARAPLHPDLPPSENSRRRTLHLQPAFIRRHTPDDCNVPRSHPRPPSRAPLSDSPRPSRGCLPAQREAGSTKPRPPEREQGLPERQWSL